MCTHVLNAKVLTSVLIRRDKEGVGVWAQVSLPSSCLSPAPSASPHLPGSLFKGKSLSSLLEQQKAAFPFTYSDGRLAGRAHPGCFVLERGGKGGCQTPHQPWWAPEGGEENPLN